MSNVITLPIKQPSGCDEFSASMSKAELVAAESLRNNWKLVDANLRQIGGCLAECAKLLQVMGESPEKEQFMKLVAKTAVDVLQQLAVSAR